MPRAPRATDRLRPEVAGAVAPAVNNKYRPAHNAEHFRSHPERGHSQAIVGALMVGSSAGAYPASVTLGSCQACSLSDLCHELADTTRYTKRTSDDLENQELPGQDGCAARDLNPEPAD